MQARSGRCVLYDYYNPDAEVVLAPTYFNVRAKPVPQLRMAGPTNRISRKGCGDGTDVTAPSRRSHAEQAAFRRPAKWVITEA